MAVFVLMGASACDRTKPTPPPPAMFDEPGARSGSEQAGAANSRAPEGSALAAPSAQPAAGAPPAAAARPANPRQGGDAGASAAGAGEAAAAAPAAADKTAPAAAALDAPPPKDSLLPGPCPLPGELAARCLRTPDKPADKVRVAHILIAWKGSAPDAPPHRTEAAARELAIKIGHIARRKGMDFVMLMHKYSDDLSEGVYTIDQTADRRFDAPFVTAARRLAPGSVDVIRSRFGFHVVTRVGLSFHPRPRPLPDLIGGVCPEVGEDAARCGIERPKPNDFKAPDQVVVAHVLVAYKRAVGRRRVNRDRGAALTLAVRVAHAARRMEADFSALQRRHSDDPGAGRYEVTPTSTLLARFRRLALRLPLGGVDVVETRYGFHVVRRLK